MSRFFFRVTLLSLFVLLTLLSLSPLVAKPMPVVSKDDFLKAPCIVLAAYAGHERPGFNDGETYMNGIRARYKLIRFLKAPLVSAGDASKYKPVKEGQLFTVRYSFHDGSACMPDRQWNFSEKCFPAKASPWILFFDKAPIVGVESFTIRGSSGRWQGDANTLTGVENSLRR